MKPTLVSVLMPAYNAATYIETAIESVLNQTYQQWELIIVNDSSTDTTEAVVKRFKDPRIRYYHNQTQLGLAKNRNKALSLTKGELIAILDADDCALPKRLETQVQLFQAHPNLVLCGSWTQVIDEHGRVLADWHFPSTSSALRAQFYIQFPIVHSSAMIRKSALKKLESAYDPHFSPAEDYELCFRLLHLGTVECVPKVLTLYRQHPTNTSSSYPNTLSETLPRLWQREYARLGYTLSLDQVKNVVLFLHPAVKKTVNLTSSLRTLYYLHQALQKAYQLGFFDLHHWYLYLFKATLLQLVNKFRV